tara:strand:+ start:1413 stop:1751 length:339 start_codon:yes stop_codon:yes gene_type:complete
LCIDWNNLGIQFIAQDQHFAFQFLDTALIAVHNGLGCGFHDTVKKRFDLVLGLNELALMERRSMHAYIFEQVRLVCKAHARKMCVVIPRHLSGPLRGLRQRGVPPLVQSPAC